SSGFLLQAGHSDRPRQVAVPHLEARQQGMREPLLVGWRQPAQLTLSQRPPRTGKNLERPGHGRGGESRTGRDVRLQILLWHLPGFAVRARRAQALAAADYDPRPPSHATREEKIRSDRRDRRGRADLSWRELRGGKKFH